MLRTENITPESIRDNHIYREWGLSDDEYQKACQLIGRYPNVTEAGLFSGMWSEHCAYKNSKPILKRFPTQGENVLQGVGEGAGVLDIGDGKAIAFKAESHNHPSFVEPFQGAATGIGGIIRDIFSMGAKPVALLDSLRFGELSNKQNQYLLDQVVSGIAHYGNCIGIPTIGGETQFDASYNGNNLVNVMCAGLMDQKDLQKGTSTGTNNSIIYVGAKTGRDGINGATFASQKFESDEDPNRSAVQVGDPFMEKLLVDACLEITSKHSDSLVGIQDMGACGILSSSAEMASEGNSGVHLNLDRVPKRESGMTPYEIMLSESQERMLLCVKQGSEDEIKEVFDRYGLDAVVVGNVSDDGKYQLTQNGQVVADVPVHTLVDDAPRYEHELVEPDRLKNVPNVALPNIEDVNQTLLKLLAQPTIASKKDIYRQYDKQVQTNTVVGPGSDAAIIRVRHTDKSLAMTTDGNGRYAYLDPYQGGQIAVSEAARNIVASGGDPMGITDCLNFGNPDNSDSYYELDRAVSGMASACEKLETPVVSGNVSLYNETDEQAIYPTPIVGMVGLIKSNDLITTKDFKEAGDAIYVIGKTYDDYSGSEIQKMLTGQINGNIHHFDLANEHQNQNLVQEAIQDKLLNSAHDLSEGGLGIGLAKCLFNNDLGFNGDIDLTKDQLFAETQSRFIVSVSPKRKEAFEELLTNSNMQDEATLIGHTTKENSLSLSLKDQAINVSVERLKEAFEGGLKWSMD